jgi:DNA modification methylase
LKPYYSHNGIEIYHGDCRALLPSLRADLLLTDPPYGIGEAAGANKSRNKPFGKSLPHNTRNRIIPARDYGVADWDDKTPADWLFGLMRESATWQIIFGGNYFPLPPSRCWLVWDKDNSGDFADCELAWTNLDKAVRKIRWRWNGMLQEHMDDKEVRVHPTQKPEAVMRWAIKQAPESVQSVLDPFLGSGTSLVAAKALGKSGIGIEREEKYCEIAAKRLSQEVFSFGAGESQGVDAG